ncbi:unnamed protein product [Adineta ricciae]|uniref:Uncharacterized protein n=1 Tax=Adineta ricciae TaxID=249248 RepID=A0A815E7P8_ADIRI|nr:unnamed protein product [Adineta ricciae]CAF1454759.1 unnamed protein product [Adineta ricciae]
MALDYLRQAVYGKNINSEYVSGHGSAPKPVKEDEWKSFDKQFFGDMSGGFTLVETSAEDMAKIEELLEVKPGFFTSPYVIKTKKECCEKCGRRNNFLDVVTTGLRVHKPAFLIDVFSGKFGHILNSQEHQVCVCYGCGTQLPVDAAKYSAPKPCTGSQKPRACYRWNF